MPSTSNEGPSARKSLQERTPAQKAETHAEPASPFADLFDSLRTADPEKRAAQRQEFLHLQEENRKKKTAAFEAMRGTQAQLLRSMRSGEMSRSDYETASAEIDKKWIEESAELDRKPDSIY